MNLFFDFHTVILDEIKKVTRDDIIECTEKYLLKDHVTVVLAPDEYLNF